MGNSESGQWKNRVLSWVSALRRIYLVSGIAPSTERQRLSRQAINRLFVCCVVIVVGGVWDVYNHSRGEVAKWSTIFTWPHDLIYLGSAGILYVILPPMLANMRDGFSMTESVPLERGGRMLLGLILMVGAVPVDGIGHALWGFEAGLESLASVPHLAFACGIFIVFSHFFWSYVSDHPNTGVISVRSFAALISLILTVTVAGLLFHFFNAPSIAWGMQSWPGVISNVEQGDNQQVVFTVTTEAQRAQAQNLAVSPGIMGYLLDSMFLVAVTLVIASQFKLPTGTWVLIYGLHALWVFLIGQLALFLPLILLGIIVEFALLRRFPIFGLPRLRNVVILGEIIPFLLVALSEAVLALMGVNSWQLYSNVGLPFFVAAGGWFLAKVAVFFYERGVVSSRGEIRTPS